MNQRPGKLKKAISSGDKGQMISAFDLKLFLDNAQKDLNNKGEIEAATRFEIFRDYINDDVIELNKQFSYNHGISLGL